jgi:hypothetical protein
MNRTTNGVNTIAVRSAALGSARVLSRLGSMRTMDVIDLIGALDEEDDGTYVQNHPSYHVTPPCCFPTPSLLILLPLLT